MDKVLEVDLTMIEAEGSVDTLCNVVDHLVNIRRLFKATSVIRHVNKQLTKALEGTNGELCVGLKGSLRLQIQDIGLLGLLCFGGGPLHAKLLATTDVETKTKATAIESKDSAVMLGRVD